MAIEKIINEPLRQEIDDLKILANSPEKIEETVLQKVYNAFKNDQTRKFHKPLTLFPTGTVLMDECAMLRAHIMLEKHLAEELGKLEAPTPVEEAISFNGPVMLPNADHWKVFTEGIVKVMAKASERRRP